MSSRRDRLLVGLEEWGPWAVGGLIVAAVFLLAMAQSTPWHTDADAYFAGLHEIRSRLYNAPVESSGVERFDEASAAFHALQDRYRTPKWLLADLGYAALAWSALLAVLCAAGRPLGVSRRVVVLAPTSLAAVALLVAGGISAAVQIVGRQQVPIWADNSAIPVVGSLMLGILLLPIVLGLVLAPVALTRREPASLWSLAGRGWLTSVVVSLVYSVPMGFAAAAAALFWQTGGWAVSTGGALLLWLFLNARAVWLGRVPASRAEPLP